MDTPEPIFDIAHLGHVELLTNKPQESLDFFTKIFGLTESGRGEHAIALDRVNVSRHMKRTIVKNRERLA